ncbi:MAG: antiviral reverse transcriptase Drt3b [Parasphingorhabdus sp.]|nr:antiviral reverse transcriptase Drt3b [Parasphingorhabdus sp.]
MTNKKTRLAHRMQRPVLSDVLPFEVPASFNNRHFFHLIAKYKMRLQDNHLVWQSSDDRVDVFARLICGDNDSTVTSHTRWQFGKLLHIRQIEVLTHRRVTMPFQFQICHKSNSGRTLTVPHPLNQLAVAEFYNDHSDTIIYFAGLSDFSIRKPTEVARFSNFNDRLHEKLLNKEESGIEESGREYDQLGSFFVYKQYSNIFKFFESYSYHRAEKRFNAMAQIDVSKCFDSIYTHSLPWAVHGKRSVKDGLTDSKTTFGGKFDALLQNINQNETNGIVIGPEFSRIFAEIILQSVDTQLEKRLRDKHELLHKVDYRIFRYVDDYFIFFDSSTNLETITENLKYFLSEVKLHINDAKTIIYEKPIITGITIAKNQIASLLAESLRAENKDVEPVLADDEKNGDESEHSSCQKVSFHCKIDSNRLIIEYKSILKITGVSYLNVSNYAFSVIEKRTDEILSCYARAEPGYRTEKTLISSLTSLMEFSFFLYSASPRVNLSIRLARTITVICKSIRDLCIGQESRHHFFKYVHDNASDQLKKNRSLEFKEIENLYLLTALRELGRNYWIDEDVLRQHMLIKIDSENENQYYRDEYLGYFSITVSLLYMGSKRKYAKLRSFVEMQAVEKIETREKYRYRDAEVLMLAIDMLAYPHLSASARSRICAVYDLDAGDLTKLKDLSESWFTTWNRGSLLEELDAKRSREVY